MTAPTAIVRFAEEELARAPAMVDQAFQAVVGALTQPSDSLPVHERILAADLAQALAKQRPRMVAAYSATLRDCAAAELAPGSTPVANAAPATNKPRKLALVDEEAVSADVEIARATQALLNAADHELRELATFLSTLAGNPQVLRDHNPLRPEAHARALWAAALALTDDHGVQAAFMRQASTILAQSLRKSYAASCGRLEDAGIEPAAYRTVILHAGVRTGREAVGAPVAAGPQPGASSHTAACAVNHGAPTAHNAGADAPALQDLAHTLSALATTLLAAVPAAIAGSTPSSGFAKGGDVMPTGSPSRIGTSAFGGTESRALPSTRSAPLPAEPLPAARQPDFLQRLFDAALADRRLPPDIKQCLAKVQSLVVQLAASDASLVERDDHPAWAFIDRIAWQGEILPTDPDRERLRTVQVIDGVIAELLRDGTPDAARFAWAAERVTALERNRFERRVARHAGRSAALAATELQLTAAAGSSALDVGALPTVPSQLYDPVPKAADGPSAGNAWLDERAPGDVVRLFVQARWVHAQLLWLGSRREVWLWADCRSDETWPFRRGALRVLRDEGLAQIAQPRSLLRDAAIRLDAQARRRQAA